MSSTVVLGGSVAGLASALALSESGRDVVVLERDGQPTPNSVAAANADWSRPTVPQAAHSHAFGSLGTNLVRSRAPELYRALVAAGSLEIDLAARRPPMFQDWAPQPGDEDLRMLGTRRATFDMLLRHEVLDRRGVDCRLGTTVRGVEVSRGPGPRVVGVRTDAGEVIPADVVIDATGRRSAGPRWLTDAGMPAPQRTVLPCDITYYTRFYQLDVPQAPAPLNRGFGSGGSWGHYTAVLFLGDNETFSVSIGVLPEDKEMKALRDDEAFTRALRATPLLAPWVADGVSRPLTQVRAMAGLDNSLVLPPHDGPAVPAGFYPIGDAACTTNPAYGRGVSLALAHAFALTDVLTAHPDADARQAREVAGVTERLMRPWFAESVRNDRGRALLWRSTVAGAPPPQPPPGVLTFGQVAEAAAVDSTVWRRLLRVMMTLDCPASVYEDEDVRERVGKALAGGPVPQPPAPDRHQFVRAVTDASN